jgi:hypothetical protein
MGWLTRATGTFLSKIYASVLLLGGARVCENKLIDFLSFAIAYQSICAGGLCDFPEV